MDTNVQHILYLYMLYTFTMIFYPLPFTNTSLLFCLIHQQLYPTSILTYQDTPTPIPFHSFCVNIESMHGRLHSSLWVQRCPTSFHIPILYLHIIIDNPPSFQCLISICVVNSHFIKFYTSKLLTELTD